MGASNARQRLGGKLVVRSSKRTAWSNPGLFTEIPLTQAGIGTGGSWAGRG